VGRVVADPKINGYFLNMDVDGGNLVSCLVKQIGELTGGPEVYDCRGMVESHEGLGISQADYDDLAGHLVAELMERGVAEEDIGVIAGVLTAPELVGQIVENPLGNETLYHRLGRKPGIEGAIDLFLAEVTSDARINGAFANANVPRLRTCLVRQVCEVAGGPCKYGSEVEPEVIGEDGLGSVCKDMASSHAGLGISKADFDALVEDLVTVLTEAGVPEADIGLIGGALGPLCPDIVENGTGCTE
jgi:hemoglobin